jgi:ribA/ribD-fused uncharacterized protein
MPYNNQWLLEQIDQGLTPKYIFFWGHQPRKDGVISKSCFSQWFERGFDWKGINYPTAEHWMMAEKARLFMDYEMLEHILNARTAPEAKKLGRKVKGFDISFWAQHCESIVQNGNYLKFTQHEDLKTFLLGTGDRILVEASPYDNIWGIGMKAGDEGIEYPQNWKGKNLLGYALMAVRDKIRD